MSFNNTGVSSEHVNVSQPNILSSKATPSSQAPQKNQGLNAPMIGRVYKAKPGCSACGKKVS